MKIVLIRPPYYAVLGSEKKIGNIPLGLCYVGAYLEQHGHEVEIFDCESLQLNEREDSGKAAAFLKWNTAYPEYAEVMGNPDHPEWERIADKIINKNPDLIGFTSYTATMSSVNYISSKIKARCDIPVVLGGPHPSSLPELSLQESKADAVIVGEGERAILDFINDYGSDRIYHGEHIDLNDLPVPARHLLDRDIYKTSAFGYIITSRGCPYRCVFCASHTLWGRKMRQRDVDKIADEVVQVQKEYGCDVFRFADDLFPTSYKRVKGFADALSQRNCKITFRCGSRVDTVTPEILGALKESGCTEISFGVESGSQRILDLIDKGTTLVKVKKAISQTKSAGIKTIVYFMIGHPTETNEDVQATERLIEELDADRTLLNLVTPLPGTAIYQSASRDWWRYYFQGKSFDSISNIDDIDIVFRRMSEEVAERNETMGCVEKIC